MKDKAKVGRPTIDGQTKLYSFHAGETLTRGIQRYCKQECARTGHDIPAANILRQLVKKGLQA